MGIQITPSTKVGRGYINTIGGKVTVKNEEFLIDHDEKTGKIVVKDKDGKPCGEGELRKNEKKQNERSPDLKGWIRVFTDEYEMIGYAQHSYTLSVFEDTPGGTSA